MGKTGAAFWSLATMCCIGGAAACSSGHQFMSPGADPMPVSVTVSAQDIISRGMPGVRVEITNGADAGTVGVTGADGIVTVYGRTTPTGPDGLIQLRMTKDGFKSASQDFRAASANKATFSATIALTPETPLDLSGQYSLTIEADSACQSLPAAARRRTYQATITQQGSGTGFNVRLAGGTFYRNRDTISVFAGADVARVFIGVPAGIDDDTMAEQLDADSYLGVYGTGYTVASEGGAVFAGPVNATFTYCPATPSGDVFICPVAAVTCKSAAHRITLTRQ